MFISIPVYFMRFMINVKVLLCVDQFTLMQNNGANNRLAVLCIQYIPGYGVLTKI